MNKLKVFFCFLSVFAHAGAKSWDRQKADTALFPPAMPAVSDSMASLPVQSAGRVKPFDTFARETLRFVYGQDRFQNASAVEILLSWLLFPNFWQEKEFVQIQDSRLKKALSMDKKKQLFSPNEILKNPHFIREIEEIKSLRMGKVALNDYFKSLQKIENKLILYQSFQAGKIPGWIPSDSSEKTPWRSLSQFTKEETQRFQNSMEFQQFVQQKYPSYKKQTRKILVEKHYNKLKPFRLAWLLYLLGFLLLSPLIWLNKTNSPPLKKAFFYSALSVFILAFCLQGYGMALRSYIMARPPVTNMYETVIWVPWVTVILGAILWIRQKMFSVFVCAVAVAGFCLLLADSAPELLDGSLHPLEAVLRSSFWLIVHVLTITMSYGAFFLAFALGNVALFLFFKKKKRESDSQIKKYIRCIDRSLQVGVILLTGGTILGGIWADYSWGRFWGWDPKETWALISLLAYLALLHSRLMGYVREFGMAVGAVLCFFFILMAWYGVNYVLGQGLHSYGFGAGGVEYMTGFALLNLTYVLLVWAFCPPPK